MKRAWYAMPDSTQSDPFQIDPKDAESLNDQGYGIFWTVNEFRGARRIQNLVKINSWYFEIDQGDKWEQWKRIQAGPIPSLIIESKRGFHVYFDTKDATKENWEKIMKDRLIPFYRADPSVHDLARLLRVPGFYHCKNTSSQYLVTEIFRSKAKYSEKEMLERFPSQAPRLKIKKRPKPQGDSFWEKLRNLDSEDALERLSGSSFVGGEIYRFKPLSNGNLNILVNGKMTACWIDRDKRIGSRSGGGPTIWQWLKWYGHSDPKVYQIIKEVFPELIEQKAG